MNDDLNKAKEILMSGGFTCVLCRGKDICTSELRGVKPLVQWVENRKDFKNYSAADKVVGKATAFLYSLLGVKAIYAHVISRSALQVLTEQNITAEYGKVVENIINRQGDGICPFESAVLNINDPQTAYNVILVKYVEKSH